ncbi:MAG: PQQ-dependent sugar dehydrogenase [Planctomycetota bacterium]|nr:PQQ-dependent sugar dehydrogenase [Planctomycetota bacterium]
MHKSANIIVTSALSLVVLHSLASPAWAYQTTAPATAPAVVTAGDLPKALMMAAFPNLAFKRPVGITHALDGSDRLFVIEQKGRIKVFQNASDVSETKVFLDIREQVYMQHNEEGLLALEFHPEYKTKGHFYVYYSANEPRRGVLSRFSVSSDDPGVADPESEHIIMEFEQPYGNHNGCTIAFGPDGFLYVSLGDGGWLGDPKNNGQDLSTLLGTILRIDIDNTQGDLPYAIPQDNPFVDHEDARGEIWAYGLRNVWRMSFDRATGELWAGDVGQNLFEEIDLIVKGGNYGWNIREGFHAYRENETQGEFLDPVVEYPRADGLSVTGGYVYRGASNPKLVGAYIYADYVSGKIWALRHKDGVMTMHREIHKPSSRRRYISSFGEDESGELYICAFSKLDGRGSDAGKIYRLLQQ